MTDPLGGKTPMSYDSVGRLTARVSPNGNVAGAAPSAYTTGYTTNAFGDVTRITDPLLAGQATPGTTTYTYDANRNLKGAQDPNGNTISYAYDADNEQTGVTLPLPTATPGATPVHDSTSYDGDGNVLSHTDFDGHTVGYGYDALNHLRSSTDPLNRATGYVYDPVGNLTSLTDATQPAGRTTSYSYDAANELQQVGYSDGVTPGVGFTYLPTGQRATMSDGTGTTSYGYDNRNRLTSATSGAGQAVGYGYDADSDLTALTYPGSLPVTRTYDELDRLGGVTDWLGHTMSPLDGTYSLVLNHWREGHGRTWRWSECIDRPC